MKANSREVESQRETGRDNVVPKCSDNFPWNLHMDQIYNFRVKLKAAMKTKKLRISWDFDYFTLKGAQKTNSPRLVWIESQSIFWACVWVFSSGIIGLQVWITNWKRKKKSMLISSIILNLWARDLWRTISAPKRDKNSAVKIHSHSQSQLFADGAYFKVNICFLWKEYLVWYILGWKGFH